MVFIVTDTVELPTFVHTFANFYFAALGVTTLRLYLQLGLLEVPSTSSMDPPSIQNLESTNFQKVARF